MRFSFLRLLLDPTAGEGGGGNPAPNPTPQTDPSKGYEVALAKHGNDAAAMARMTYADNEKLRGDLAATTAKVPKEGSVVPRRRRRLALGRTRQARQA